MYNANNKGIKELIEYDHKKLFESAKDINDIAYLQKMVDQLQWKYADCMTRAKNDDESFVRFKKEIKEKDAKIEELTTRVSTLESLSRGRELKINELTKRLERYE